MRFSFFKEDRAFQKNYMKAGVKKLFRACVMRARSWGPHAVEMFPTERFSLGRQMAAAAGRKSFPPCPLSIGQKESGQENGVTN